MSGAKNRLLAELKAVQKLNWLRIVDDGPDDNFDLFVWHVALVVVNPDSDFSGGYFTGELRFSADYPYKPPTFRFTTPAPLFHPNIYYPSGAICISILHSPGDDAMSGEQAGERWSPLQGVESVMLSILLLLDNPEINSPANVDASVMYRDNKAAYRARARQAVAQSQKLIPAGFVMPTTFDGGETNDKSTKPGRDVEEDDAFWVESDEEELDFGSDDSDEEEQEFDDEDEEEEGEEEQDIAGSQRATSKS